MIRVIHLVAGCSSLFIAPRLFAAQAPVAASPNAGGSLLQVISGLILVLALIAVSAWFLRKMSPGALAGAGGLRVVGGVLVGPKERVVVVEFRDSWLLLGVTAGQVTLLQSGLRPTDGVNASPVLPAAQFSDWMKQVLQKSRQSNHNPD